MFRAYREFLVLIFLLSACSSDVEVSEVVERTHQIPAWFDDAKVGIFIHWGPASVPAYAGGKKFESGQLEDMMNEGQLPYEVPYSEWYQFVYQQPGGKTQRWHAEHYGAEKTYDIFIPMFENNVKQWDASSWAEQFVSFGAKYVVLVTKHHDGYTLWPSDVENSKKSGWNSRRDLVGELGDAVRDKGMRYGTYYSSGIDWTFNLPATGTPYERFVKSGPQGADYADYVDAHLRELIDEYRPDVIWSDIGYPSEGRRDEVLSYYFETVPEGVVNDRWSGFDKAGKIANLPGGVWLIKLLRKVSHWTADESEIEHSAATGDLGFATSEYTDQPEILPYKWESTRGLGGSFGFNHLETAEDILSREELIRFVADTVSKNGNVLINVGPDSYGQIPEIQQSPLRELGRWLSVNGKAIYGSRPWNNYGVTLPSGVEVRFTQDDENLYVIVLGEPDGELVIPAQGFQPSAVKVLAQAEIPFEVQEDEWIIKVGNAAGENSYGMVLEIAKPE